MSETYTNDLGSCYFIFDFCIMSHFRWEFHAWDDAWDVRKYAILLGIFGCRNANDFYFAEIPILWECYA